MTRPAPKYPDIYVPLVGEDGNAFSIIGRAMKAMRRAKLPESEMNAFRDEATTGSYDQLLQAVMRWFETE